MAYEVWCIKLKDSPVLSHRHSTREAAEAAIQEDAEYCPPGNHEIRETKTYTLWVLVVDTETKQTVDLYPAEIADMSNLEQARLAAKFMAGLV